MTPALRLQTSGPVRRRRTRVVRVGGVAIGGDNPVRVQSMITCDTMDTAASIQQSLDLAGVGCEIVRITAPTVKDARNLEFIKTGLRERGCEVPLVADIHFKPDAAMEAAKWVEKVRGQSGQLRGFQEIRRQGVHRRAVCRRAGAHPRAVHAVGAAVQGARHRHPHRHQPRLVERPHHEPLRPTRRWAWSRARWNLPASRAA